MALSMFNHKFCPKRLKDFTFSKTTSSILQSQLQYTQYYIKETKSYTIENMIIFGTDGCGKRARAHAFLNELFDIQDITKQTDVKIYTLRYKNNKYEYNVLVSPFHIEFNLADHGVNDYYIIKDYITKISGTKNVYTNSPHIILIPHFNKTTLKAQLFFRRTMEKEIKNIRFIFTSSNLNIEKALLSRCVLIRVSSPSLKKIKSILKKIISNQLPEIKKIVSKSKIDKMLEGIIFQTRQQSPSIYNLKQSIHILQLSINHTDKSFNLYVDPNMKLIYNLNKIIKNTKILTKSVYENINSILYELYTNDYNFQNLLKHLIFNLLESNTLKNKTAELIQKSADISHKLAIGKHSIIPIQGFIFDIMQSKQQLINT